MGAETVLAFGPWLVRGGEINPALETAYRTKEPRTAIGMIEPYHYVALFVEGRVKRSGGVPVEWLAERMAQLGATEAINLDGGKTSCLLFHGHEDQQFQPRRAGARRAQRVGPDRPGRERPGAEWTGLDK